MGAKKGAPSNNKGKFKYPRYDYDVYYVYYLPKENYCGIAVNTPNKRVASHKWQGKDVEGWTILFASDNKSEAYYHEAMFHSVLGMKGLNYKSNKECSLSIL